MYDVNYSGRTSSVSSYLYCRIQRKHCPVMLHECDLLATAEFPVHYTVGRTVRRATVYTTAFANVDEF